MDASLAPVIHGLTTQELERNCASIQRVDAAPKWVCLGGLVPLVRQSGQLGANASSAQAELRSRIGLRPGQVPVIAAARARGWIAAYNSRCVQAGAGLAGFHRLARAAGFGTVFLPGGTEPFVADRGRKRAASRLLLTEADLGGLALCECPACARAGDLGRRIASLAGSYLPRAAHNAWVLLGEACQHRMAARASNTG